MIKGKTGNGLVEYCKAQVGLPYWCGTFGQTATKWLYEYNKKRLPAYYTADDFESQFGKRVHDCIGLIKGYMWSATPTSEPVYNASQDVSVAVMYNTSSKKGVMSTINLSTNGILLYNKLLSHVGVYSTDGYVYQALGHAYGVVKTKFRKSDWYYWSECPYIEYSSEPVDVDFDVSMMPLLQYSSLGKAVQVWQTIIGVEPDGIFGEKTKLTTIECQKLWFPNNAEEWDGIVGEKTWSKGLLSLC